jgi:hypothetical protein
MCVRVRPWGQELTRAERPENSIQCGTHGWQRLVLEPTHFAGCCGDFTQSPDCLWGRSHAAARSIVLRKPFGSLRISD